jgi:hypothetical protein
MKNIVGKHYQAQRSASEIVKLVKAEIKAKYPSIEFSVSKRLFAGGKSIDVAIYDFGYNPFQQAFIEFVIQHAEMGRYQELYQGESDPIYIDKAIAQSYNFDHSDVMSDYFHVNFYGHVSIEENHQVVLYMPDGKFRDKTLHWYPQLQPWAERKTSLIKTSSLQEPYLQEVTNPQTSHSLDSSQFAILHNVAKKGIEVKLFALSAQTESYRTWLKQKGFRWTSHHVLWYAPFSEVLMQQVLLFFKLDKAQNWKLSLKSFAENLVLI